MLSAPAFAECAEIEIAIPDALPSRGERRVSSVRRIAVRQVVLRAREMSKHANVLNGLKQKIGTAASLLVNELHGAALTCFAREKEGDHAVVERPVTLEVPIFNELDRAQEV